MLLLGDQVSPGSLQKGKEFLPANLRQLDCIHIPFLTELQQKRIEKDYVSFSYCVYIKPNCGPFLISKTLPWQLLCTGLIPPSFEAHHLCKSYFAS